MIISKNESSQIAVAEGSKKNYEVGKLSIAAEGVVVIAGFAEVKAYY